MPYGQKKEDMSSFFGWIPESGFFFYKCPLLSSFFNFYHFLYWFSIELFSRSPRHCPCLKTCYIIAELQKKNVRFEGVRWSVYIFVFHHENIAFPELWKWYISLMNIIFGDIILLEKYINKKKHLITTSLTRPIHTQACCAT